MTDKTKIGIFELSELFGISPSAIRKYEMKGIILPERDSDNKYRKYSSWEVLKMVYVRGLSRDGFSLKQMSEMMNAERPMDHLEEVEKLQEELAKEIVHKKRLIAYLDWQKKEFMVRQFRKEKLQIEHMPTLLTCELLCKDRIADKDIEGRKNLKEWIQALPFVSLYTVCNKDEVGSVYLGISDENAQKFGLTELKPERIFLEKMCVTCELRYDKDEYMGNFMRETFDMVRKSGFEVEDTFILWQHGFFQEKDTYVNYSKAYFPIKEFFEY